MAEATEQEQIESVEAAVDDDDQSAESTQTIFEDDEDELKEMAEFYKKKYSRVYFIYDMIGKGVVGVEVVKAGQIGPLREGRSFFNYKNRLLSIRTRLDKTPAGKPMVGYESISGNDTRLSEIERGEVEVGNRPVGSLSPFEREQLEQKIADKQANQAADYESGVDDDGREFERFETFKIVRVK